jgi:hypothetical protein
MLGRPPAKGRCGSASVEKGTSADENQVSSTSSSRARPPCQPAARACASASSSLRATNTVPSCTARPSASALYQAGIWWPHQSWREMHQSWMFSSQWLYVEVQFSGTKRIEPSATTSSDFCAMLLPGNSVPSGAGLLIATNHWSVSIGSMTALVRSPRGTISRCGLTDSSRPSVSRSATICLRAS